jgi:DNA replication licensing factor MCM4
VKLHHQAQAYPQEMIPLMDQVIHNIMVQLAEEEMKRQRAAESQSSAGLSQRHQIPSSDMPIPSSDRGDLEQTPAPSQATKALDILAEVDQTKYKVRMFGIESTINLRDLDPSGKSPSMVLT